MRPIGPGVEIRPVLPRILWSYGGLEINEKAERRSTAGADP